MSKAEIIKKLEKKQLKKKVPDFRIGDTVRVHTRIIEGSKERTQVFMGTVIARKGSGASETFSVHRVAFGSGMERVFPLHSPRIAKIEVVKHGQVRRAKLYYLRGTTGKKSKVKSKIGQVRKEIEEKVEEEIIIDNEKATTDAPEIEEASTSTEEATEGAAQ
jgi:large subunit ribosomal protein L19